MTLTTDDRPEAEGHGARDRGRITWATVDSGFHVASTAGNFVGSVYATESGAFVAYDGTSTPLGRYQTREAAQSAVEAWEPPEERARKLALDRSMLPAATVSAVVAGGVAAMAGLLAPLL